MLLQQAENRELNMLLVLFANSKAGQDFFLAAVQEKNEEKKRCERGKTEGTLKKT